MSRTKAAGKINLRTGEVIKPGAISQEMLVEWLRRERVVLRGGGLDEAPKHIGGCRTCSSSTPGLTGSCTS